MSYYLQSHYQDEIVPYWTEPYDTYDSACYAAREYSKNSIAWGTVEVIFTENNQIRVLTRYCDGKEISPSNNKRKVNLEQEGEDGGGCRACIAEVRLSTSETRILLSI